MTGRDWRILKSDFEIAAEGMILVYFSFAYSVQGGGIPNPLRSWDEAKVSISILKVIEKIGYKEPTPIQRQAIPIAMGNRDLIGIAETGSGKTAAFLIPIFSFIERQVTDKYASFFISLRRMPKMTEENAQDGPYALILAPTRELAQQIEVESKKFSHHLGYKVVSIVGGHDLGEQSFHMRNGAEIVIATPGRLRDCLDRKILALNQCTYLVMDEGLCDGIVQGSCIADGVRS
jgi:ATP-dependent RNA helicase DDX23/PRP28